MLQNNVNICYMCILNMLYVFLSAVKKLVNSIGPLSTAAVSISFLNKQPISVLADILLHILLGPMKPVVPETTEADTEAARGSASKQTSKNTANASASPKHEVDAVIHPSWLKGASACSEPGGNEAYLVS